MLNLQDANKLFLQASVVLAEMENYGIRVDEKYVDRAIERVGKRIQSLQDELKQDEIWAKWQEKFPLNASLGSRYQLAEVLFKVMGIPYPGKTKTATQRYKTGEKTLSLIDNPFVKKWMKTEHLKKTKSTYLDSLKEELWDGYVHVNHQLNTVASYRSGCSSINIQNQMNRDPVMRKIVRRCFIPRDGHALVATDFSGHEFRIASCRWRDPAMMEYASDPSKDIHRDVTCRLFKCPKESVNRDIRYIGKNGFVFPVLYGSYHANCGPNIWYELPGKKVGYISAKEWLRSQGINDVWEFTNRVKEVEDWFLGMFQVFAEKKEEEFAKYQKRGWFRMQTGFKCRGIYDRKAFFNYDPQGPAFHCLLWALIHLFKEIKKQKMGAKPLCEIHDEILTDCPVGEIPDYLDLAERFMTIDIRKAWDWIVVPLGMEAKVYHQNWEIGQPWIKENGK